MKIKDYYICFTFTSHAFSFYESMLEYLNSNENFLFTIEKGYLFSIFPLYRRKKWKVGRSSGAILRIWFSTELKNWIWFSSDRK